MLTSFFPSLERRLRLAPAGHGGRLADPLFHLRLVEIVLVDIDPARILGFPYGWNGSERRALEKGYLHVVRKGMESDKPAFVRDTIEGRVPFDCVAHAGNLAR